MLANVIWIKPGCILTNKNGLIVMWNSETLGKAYI